MQCVWLGHIGKCEPHSSKWGCNTDLRPAAVGPYCTPISQNLVRISWCVLARLTAFHHSHHAKIFALSCKHSFFRPRKPGLEANSNPYYSSWQQFSIFSSEGNFSLKIGNIHFHLWHVAINPKDDFAKMKASSVCTGRHIFLNSKFLRQKYLNHLSNW